jgi:hypothetical protein
MGGPLALCGAQPHERDMRPWQCSEPAEGWSSFLSEPQATGRAWLTGRGLAVKLKVRPKGSRGLVATQPPPWRLGPSLDKRANLC